MRFSFIIISNTILLTGKRALEGKPQFQFGSSGPRLNQNKVTQIMNSVKSGKIVRCTPGKGKRAEVENPLVSIEDLIIYDKASTTTENR